VGGRQWPRGCQSAGAGEQHVGSLGLDIRRDRNVISRVSSGAGPFLAKRDAFALECLAFLREGGLCLPRSDALRYLCSLLLRGILILRD
jgi:hypothetical protein